MRLYDLMKYDWQDSCRKYSGTWCGSAKLNGRWHEYFAPGHLSKDKARAYIKRFQFRSKWDMLEYEQTPK